MRKEIYLDHAATTPTRPEVKKSMSKYFDQIYGNPNSMHYQGLKAREAIDQARKKIAKILNCLPEEIIFTSGGTESINLAIKGIAEANKNFGKHLITTKFEHHAVLEACHYLEKERGFRVTYLNLDKEGLIDLKELINSITNETTLVSVIYANNEIGTIEPIAQISELIKKINSKRKNKIYFHTDACQAAGYLDLNVNKLKVDLMTINGSKIYGPKGIGLLYVRKGTKIEPIIHGGGQEFGLRSGTENTALIVGLARALELAQKEKEKEAKRLTFLRDYFIKELFRKIPKIILNGHSTKRLPNNVNISILDIEGESLVLHLNEKRIYASTGSACASKRLEPSHVLLAIGQRPEIAHGSIRFSLGKSTKKEDIDYVLKVLPGIVESLRKISPVRIKIENKKIKQKWFLKSGITKS